jgi:spermidine synthase
MTKTTQPTQNKLINERVVLILSIFIAGLCSIVYELLISTTSSYFLGDSIKQFSITIGVYMAAMGVGSFLSRLIQTDLLRKFILVEIVLGLVGGSCVPLLYFFFASTDLWGFKLLNVLLITAIGLMTGLEIPLFTRIMKIYYPLKINLSNVLSLDYLGALVATLIFPFVLLPWLGTFKSSLIFGLINLSVGFINLWYFADVLEIKKRRAYNVAAWTVGIYFVLMLVFSNVILARWNDGLYRDDIIFYKQTQYQHLVLTKGGDDVRMYINRVIQWSSTDEYRYHEPLVHIPMAVVPYKKNILVLGGGEGLAVRELLKHPEVETITVVDLDDEVFRLAVENPQVIKINNNSLKDPRVIPIAEDAYTFLQNNHQTFDLIISDLPEPSNESLARLYSAEFFRMAQKRLSPYGIFATQATSTFHARKAFWCINSSAQAGGFRYTYPYHAYVPSFGDWGFLMASNIPLDTTDIHINVPTRFLDDPTAKQLFYFEKDLIMDSIPPSTLDQPRLLEYYMEEWEKWGRLSGE